MLKMDVLSYLENGSIANVHISSPQTVGELLDALSMYFHLMSDEDRDYVNCARIAMEEQIEWRV